MITIIHGDDIVNSRKFFSEEKEKTKNSFSLDGQNLTVNDIAQVFEGEGLFSDEKNIFIENIFSKKKQSIDFKQILGLIEKNEKNANIFIWEGKELTKSQISTFKNPVVKIFKQPQILFTFLDSIKPANSKNMIVGFHELLKTMGSELVFYMLVRQFRVLLALSDSNPSADGTIDEINRLAPWQKDKLQRQAKLFSIEQLKNIYQKLYDIDLCQKTGTLNLSLVQSIDILLISL
ncbi:MAG: hypothetical protein ABH816_03135 [Candidatus Levyibacteriota bacterium]